MSRALSNVECEWMKRRIVYTMYIIIAAFVVLAGRLFQLQIIQGEEYRRLSENNCIRLQSIAALRGKILDRHGEPLAENRPAFNLSVIPRDAKPLEETLSRLSPLLDAPAEELMRVMAERKGPFSFKPVLIKVDIDRDELAAVEARKYDLPGVTVDVQPKRHYIHSANAAHLIGYLGEVNARELRTEKYQKARVGDLVGKYGVEKLAETHLQGKRGGRQVEVDASGRVIKVLKTVDATAGGNVYLTLHDGLQRLTEQLMENKTGAVAALAPDTGEVLVLANSPAFDQNAFISGMSHEEWQSLINDPSRPMVNKAIQGEYPPASTFKIVTAVAGLEEGVIDENTRFFCPGYHRLGNRVYRCWKKSGHGSADVVKALAESCDVFFYQVGERLGVDRLAKYARMLGLGAPTGIALDHESGGLIPTSSWKKKRMGEAWQKGETLSSAIGQGFNLATPLQMAVLASSLANGGLRYKPHVIRKIESPDGDLVFENEPEVSGRFQLHEKTMKLVKRGLWDVVQGDRGTARRIRTEGIDIWGKTGTAQVVSRRLDDMENEEEIPDALKPHAWFIAFASCGRTKLAVSVIVEHGEHGSSAAAPVASALISAYMREKEHLLAASAPAEAE